MIPLVKQPLSPLKQIEAVYGSRKGSDLLTPSVIGSDLQCQLLCRNYNALMQSFSSGAPLNEEVCESTFLETLNKARAKLTVTEPKHVTTQIREVLLSETFIVPNSTKRDQPQTVYRLPLSTELVHRNFVASAAYLSSGFTQLQRVHTVLMTNLRFARVELSEDVFVESSMKNQEQYSLVVAVFENDNTLIVDAPTSVSDTEEFDREQIAHLLS